MNFFATRGFLDAAAAVYFKGRDTAVEDVRIGDSTLRLLALGEGTFVTRLRFLDYHQPLDKSEIEGPVRRGRFAQAVSRGTMKASAWDEARYPGMELAPFVDWSRFEGFSDYRDWLLTRQRGLVRDRERRGRALASDYGPVVFTMDDGNQDVLAMAQIWKSRQLRQIGFPDFFDDPRTMQFFDALRARGLLVCSSLRAGGQLVSLWIGFVHQGTWSGWVFAYDPQFRKYSVGHQLLIRMLEESCRLGHREFDFSGCAQDYKMDYATHGRLIGNIGTPPPLRAAALRARDMLRTHSPGLFAAALRAKWALGMIGRGT